MSYKNHTQLVISIYIGSFEKHLFEGKVTPGRPNISYLKEGNIIIKYDQAVETLFCAYGDVCSTHTLIEFSFILYPIFKFD